jgi:hypothetical protein
MDTPSGVNKAERYLPDYDADNGTMRYETFSLPYTAPWGIIGEAAGGSISMVGGNRYTFISGMYAMDVAGALPMDAGGRTRYLYTIGSIKSGLKYAAVMDKGMLVCADNSLSEWKMRLANNISSRGATYDNEAVTFGPYAAVSGRTSDGHPCVAFGDFTSTGVTMQTLEFPDTLPSGVYPHISVTVRNDTFVLVLAVTGTDVIYYCDSWSSYDDIKDSFVRKKLSYGFNIQTMISSHQAQNSNDPRTYSDMSVIIMGKARSACSLDGKTWYEFNLPRSRKWDMIAAMDPYGMYIAAASDDTSSAIFTQNHGITWKNLPSYPYSEQVLSVNSCITNSMLSNGGLRYATLSTANHVYAILNEIPGDNDFTSSMIPSNRPSIPVDPNPDPIPEGPVFTPPPPDPPGPYTPPPVDPNDPGNLGAADPPGTSMRYNLTGINPNTWEYVFDIYEGVAPGGLEQVEHDDTLGGTGTASDPLTVLSGGGLQSVIHDSSLTGDGTSATPLAVVTSGFASATALANEVTARTNADTQLTSDLAAEITNRANAVTGVQTGLNAEITSRTTEVAALGTRIDNEATSRTSADTALGTRIDNETTSRSQADAALSLRIDAVENLGHYLGSTATYADLASFTLPANATTNDFVTVRADETHSGAITRYILTNLSPVTWTYDFDINTDVSGKMDKITNPSANLNKLTAVAADGNVTPLVDPNTLASLSDLSSHANNTAIHTTAAEKTAWGNKLGSVSHDATMTGDGTSSSPLSVVPPPATAGVFRGMVTDASAIPYDRVDWEVGDFILIQNTGQWEVLASKTSTSIAWNVLSGSLDLHYAQERTSMNLDGNSATGVCIYIEYTNLTDAREVVIDAYYNEKYFDSGVSDVAEQHGMRIALNPDNCAGFVTFTGGRAMPVYAFKESGRLCVHFARNEQNTETEYFNVYQAWKWVGAEKKLLPITTDFATDEPGPEKQLIQMTAPYQYHGVWRANERYITFTFPYTGDHFVSGTVSLRINHTNYVSFDFSAFYPIAYNDPILYFTPVCTEYQGGLAFAAMMDKFSTRYAQLKIDAGKIITPQAHWQAEIRVWERHSTSDNGPNETPVVRIETSNADYPSKATEAVLLFPQENGAVKLANTGAGTRIVINAAADNKHVQNGCQILFDLWYNETVSGNYVIETFIHGWFYVDRTMEKPSRCFIVQDSGGAAAQVYAYQDDGGAYCLWIPKTAQANFPGARVKVYSGLSGGAYTALPVIIDTPASAPAPSGGIVQCVDKSLAETPSLVITPKAGILGTIYTVTPEAGMISYGGLTMESDGKIWGKAGDVFLVNLPRCTHTIESSNVLSLQSYTAGGTTVSNPLAYVTSAPSKYFFGCSDVMTLWEDGYMFVRFTTESGSTQFGDVTWNGYNPRIRITKISSGGGSAFANMSHDSSLVGTGTQADPLKLARHVTESSYRINDLQPNGYVDLAMTFTAWEPMQISIVGVSKIDIWGRWEGTDSSLATTHSPAGTLSISPLGSGRMRIQNISGNILYGNIITINYDASAVFIYAQG